MTKQLPFIALALAGAAFAAPSAQATISYNDGDLVVVFSSSATTPHTGKTVLIDFGNASQFISGGSLHDGQIHTVNTANTANWLADLSTAGISLAVATYSIQGADLNTDQNLYLSQAEAVRGTAGTPYANGSTGVPNNDLSTMFFSFGSAANPSATPQSFIQNTSDVNSYASYVFGTNSPTQAYQAYSNPEGSLSKVLDLFNPIDTATGPAPLVGAFDFNSTTGALRFDSNPAGFAAAPEPTALVYSLGMLAAGCGVFRFRTRRVLSC